jgi:phage baseplate assembly protein W
MCNTNYTIVIARSNTAAEISFGPALNKAVYRMEARVGLLESATQTMIMRGQELAKFTSSIPGATNPTTLLLQFFLLCCVLVKALL